MYKDGDTPGTARLESDDWETGGMNEFVFSCDSIV